ncbi:PREDICTED: ceramide kinase isoform X2 [Tarenaya hassleriana]|uniref:ceramide kinase isoform X2 n=1 Tax=Tarenaya hassleriana TaxID=28532 RepID=UPI00053C6142|nr:PREDICTED: ceramide kinase isoform X2 [Tarenaya hassleriana]
MESRGDNCGFSRSADGSDGNGDRDGGSSVMSGNFFLDYVGEVILTQNSNGLSWKSLDSSDNEGSTCLGIGASQNVETEMNFSDIYAVEFASYGSLHCSKSSLRNAKERFPGRRLHTQEMYRFTVHGLQKSVKEPCLWKLAGYTFGHVDLQTCQMWMDWLNYFLIKQVGRPRNLLVFVHPRSGKGNGCKTWESVSLIFARAKVKTKVIVTERAGHAFDVMACISKEELHSYDGVIAVGGDGFFNEIFNGYLLSRLKVPLPPTPSDSFHSIQSRGSSSVPESGDEVLETNQKEDHPLLPGLVQNVSNVTDFRTVNGSCEENEDTEHLFNGERLRFGLIPAGSTDAVVMCTTGARDPITSALHIVLGREVNLDAVQVVRWKTTSSSPMEPFIRYAASFAGYGFYGDVISESEKYRWMGPNRYDYVGTKVFLKHRSYEAEVAYEEVETENAKSPPQNGNLRTKTWPFRNSIKSERILCRAGCSICNSKDDNTLLRNYSCPEGTKWSRSRGRFLSIGAAVISNRNERAPDGLVADAHLSDGFVHLILIRDCSRPKYLWHLTELAKRGGDPLNFEFVEYHKTRAFTFRSVGSESVWNLDGEMLQAHQLSAQVLRGLIPLFASGPEV